MVTFEDILKEAGYSDLEIEGVRGGKLHQGGSLQAASDKELSVKLAFHIKNKLENVKEIFISFPKKKEFDPTVTELGMIAEDGGDGSLDDFSEIKLEPNGANMTKTYLKAAAGSAVNLSKEEIALFKKLKGKDQVDVEECLRQILLDRFRAYKKNGLAGVKSYARSKKEFNAGDELENQIKNGTILKSHAPIFYKYLLEYPNNKPEGVEENFFWVNSTIDDKPTIALCHRVGMPLDGGFVYMERHFYISRSHNCLQGVGAALPVEDGTVVMYGTRTSTDQVSGFGGSAKRAIGNRIMGGRMADNFERARKLAAASTDMGSMKL